MTTEQYSIGYDEGYQAGWNAAMDAKPAQQQEQVIAWITNGSLYGLRRTNKKTAVIHREETKVARIPVFIKVDA